MSRSRSLLRVLGLLALTSCIDRSSSSLFVYIDEGSAVATFRSGSDGPIVAISLDVYAENEGLTYLDSALVVVNTDGLSTTFNDPTIDAPGFPAEYDGGVVDLEVPSPIVDIDTFDLFCESAGRSADVTLRFYNEQADRDVSLPPPITESSISLPLFRPGIAPAPNVFGSAGFQTTSAFGEGVSLSSIGPGFGD